MVRVLPIADWLALSSPVLDVRSSGEFAHGHIPGAKSLPLFTDTERAVVGTLYKQQGRDAAMLEGLRAVGPKLSGLVEEARATAPDGHIRVHCWRGGERSGSVAWLLDKAGFGEVRVLQGGYKAFRGEVLAGFSRTVDLRVLGGYTGSGKTEVLAHLRECGADVIDLEAIARHKGSAFGTMDGVIQPSTEQFENLLWAALREHADRPVWVEDESRTIGRVKIPDAFFAWMQEAPMFFVDVPRAERVERLMGDYGTQPSILLAEAIGRIAKRLGPQHVKAALEALDGDDRRAVAHIVLHYYDKAYTHAMAARTRVTAVPYAPDLRALADLLITHANDLRDR